MDEVDEVFILWGAMYMLITKGEEVTSKLRMQVLST
jgi:hypothetical protein